MDYWAEIAKQGFLGAVVVIEATIIFYLYKKVTEQYEKRMEESAKFKDITLGTVERQTNAISNLQKIQEANSTLLQDLKYTLKP